MRKKKLAGCFFFCILFLVGNSHGTSFPDSLLSADHSFFKRLPYQTDMDKNLNHAVYLYEQGHKKVSRHLFNRMIRILERTDNYRHSIIVRRRLGELLQKDGLQEEAVDEFKQCFQSQKGVLDDEYETLFGDICEIECVMPKMSA